MEPLSEVVSSMFSGEVVELGIIRVEIQGCQVLGVPDEECARRFEQFKQEMRAEVEKNVTASIEKPEGDSRTPIPPMIFEEMGWTDPNAFFKGATADPKAQKIEVDEKSRGTEEDARVHRHPCRQGRRGELGVLSEACG